MTRKQRRLTLIALGLVMLGASAALVLNALRDSVVFFFSPSEAIAKQIEPAKRFRLGGLVEAGSFKREGMDAHFVVTDTKTSIPVRYHGVLPDLFREGQGVIAEGKLGPDGVFTADTVLAKHDENYMPREVADALKKQGHWQPAGQAQERAAENAVPPANPQP